MESSGKKIRWGVFLVPWILAIITIILNFVSGEAFNNVIMTITNFILDDFSWLFALMAFICVILIIAAYFSKFGKVRIGGRNASIAAQATTQGVYHRANFDMKPSVLDFFSDEFSTRSMMRETVLS